MSGHGIGLMRDHLVLMKPVRQQGRCGDLDDDFEDTQTVSAYLYRIGGHRSEEVSEHFPDHTAEFRIYRGYPLEENWQVRHLETGIVYIVSAITSHPDPRFCILHCDRYNP